MLSKILFRKMAGKLTERKQWKTRHTGMLNKIIVSTEQDGR